MKPNVQKSQCFFSAVGAEVQQQILSITGFGMGILPITYLGLPLITFRLRFADCQPLLSRFLARIECWTAFFLSFSGRLVLIRSILNGIAGFWSMFLFLPKMVLKQLNSLIFKFLWGGFYKANGRCHYKVNWQECCHSKQEGGLGIRNIFEWNKAAVLYQLWRSIQPGVGSIWVNWFNRVLLKNKGFWTATIPYKCSWSVRKIFNARSAASDYVRYYIGPNSKFRFWLDPWINNKPLINVFGSQAVSNFESNSLVLIQSFRSNGHWILPPSNHISAVEIKDLVQRAQIHSTDHLTWDGIQQSKVKIATVRDSFRQRNILTPWYEFVWNHLSIPKCSFILWLALKNRLLTRDRMLDCHMNTSPTCLFCNNPESITHLLTDCPYFGIIRLACPIDFNRNWSQCQVGNIFASGIDKKHQQIGSLFIAVAIYLLWKERNFRVHNPGPGHGSLSIIFQLKQLVREKLFSSRRFKKWITTDPTLICLLY